MKVLHNVGHRWKADQVDALADRGITVVEDKFSWISLSAEQFELLRSVLQVHNAMYAVGADFERSDIFNARWLALTGLSEFGYPQPEDTFDFVDMVYDSSHSCKTCGVVSARQKNPFRIKSDKTKLKAFELEWVFDEIFVKKELHEELFTPLGIGSWPVIIHGTGRESENLVQLDLPECEWAFDMTGIEFEFCSECNRKKYRVRPMDFLPQLNGEPPNQIFKGKEFYGSGAQAAKRIYLSQEIMQEFVNRKIANWYQFYPLAN